MGHLTILLAVILLGCTEGVAVMEIDSLPDCTIEVADRNYECDKEDRIQNK